MPSFMDRTDSVQRNSFYVTSETLPFFGSHFHKFRDVWKVAEKTIFRTRLKKKDTRKA